MGNEALQFPHLPTQHQLVVSSLKCGSNNNVVNDELWCFLEVDKDTLRTVYIGSPVTLMEEYLLTSEW